MGLLLGLYQFERESRSEFKSWAVDAPGEFAATIIAAWQGRTAAMAGHPYFQYGSSCSASS
jgi:hypothetical protein